ncbi:hypothetical protein XSR1_150064 [Xenorhabdus szentirmaii DSM 16338]|uniref:Uncharacterized protein n=1 Tax=Xenorhabdus szentirmaii DSM 16338 TaxID=1427518 RepID=W1ITE6_9GAMM|nr:hypothetical protein XSR1_150064 [Xenorhabdus szentirmaii DSM 16338]
MITQGQATATNKFSAYRSYSPDLSSSVFMAVGYYIVRPHWKIIKRG